MVLILKKKKEECLGYFFAIKNSEFLKFNLYSGFRSNKAHSSRTKKLT